MPMRLPIRLRILSNFTLPNPAAMSPAQAGLLNWNWRYSAAGITASGTLTTVDTPDASGFYLIAGITGTRDGETITGLQAAGTAIPGNEPFAVDNLIRLTGPRLTHNGFGFSTSGGNFANPFDADFLPTPSYVEYFSTPSFTGGKGPEDSELPIGFTANRVPEPGNFALMLAGFGLLGIKGARASRP